MYGSIITGLGALAVSVALATPAAAADAMRCNVQVSPGLYSPVLRVVTADGTRDIRMGAEGLTRQVFYRDSRVRAYLGAAMNIPASELPSSISRTCGAVEEASRASTRVTVARPAPTVAREPSYEEPRSEPPVIDSIETIESIPVE
ncbi:hypothetical protein [Litoreibacter albidus]|uniref:hypothetical protein n=1 Tax=Litoreibacter albidus TaxID=670155 RepID=UPI0037356785